MSHLGAILDREEDRRKSEAILSSALSDRPDRRLSSYKSERLKHMNDAEEKIFHPQHRFSIKKAAEQSQSQSSQAAETKEVEKSDEKSDEEPDGKPEDGAEAKDSRSTSFSSSLSQNLEDNGGGDDDDDDEKCRCLPLLERDVSIFGSTSTDNEIPMLPALGFSGASNDEGRNEEDMVDVENWEENKDNVVKNDFKFDTLNPQASNRFSGIGCPSPKTAPAALASTSVGGTTPIQSPIPSAPADVMPGDVPDSSERDREFPTSQTRSMSASGEEGNGDADAIEQEQPILEKEDNAQAPRIPEEQPEPQRAETNFSYAANKALVELFSPLYTKRAKIVTYNETARVIRSLQDTPRGVIKVNSLDARFRTSQPTASLKRMIAEAGIESDPASAPLSPRSTMPNPFSSEEAEDETSGDATESRNKGKQRADAPPLPARSSNGIDGNDDSVVNVDDAVAESERRLSTELSQLLIRNDALRQELLQPVILPPSTFAREYKLMMSRWTEDNRISSSQGEKRWRQHVNDCIDDANEALENAVDTWMFKRNGDSKSTGASAEDDVMVQMAKDELACAKNRKDWFRGYRRQRRKETWRKFWRMFLDILLCRWKDREGPLVEVLRKMSDDQGDVAAGEKKGSSTVRGQSRKGSRDRTAS